MTSGNPLGLGTRRLFVPSGTDTERVIVQRPVQRILRFLGYCIDDVCNDPIVRREVYGYYKLYKYIQRSMEITELERWWNG